jgi:cyclopropane-fatty-acyl-phospholipid synthase
MRYFLPPSLDNLAEGYVNGHFDVQGLAQDIIGGAAQLAHGGVAAKNRFGRLFGALHHDRKKDALAIAHHYDVSNDFYALWLDPAMVYSCAYFPQANESLQAAQQAKLDHVLTKIMLKPGERLLDIGCGWGALAVRAAQKYGAKVVGVTLSKNQFELARARVAQAGLADRVEIRLQDYRDLNPRNGQFDKITSIGMFEHVGLKHLPEYFGAIHALLKDGGLVLNHGITSTDPGSGTAPLGAAQFIEKYVFPNGELPHISLALHDMQAAGLEPLDVECLRRHYARTLEMWSGNYEQHADAARGLVNETTFRVWRITWRAAPTHLHKTGCRFTRCWPARLAAARRSTPLRGPGPICTKAQARAWPHLPVLTCTHRSSPAQACCSNPQFPANPRHRAPRAARSPPTKWRR